MSTRKTSKEKNTNYSAPALEKGLDVLELLAAEPHALTLQDIAQHLGRTPNELYRMLDVLVRRRYLARGPDSSYVLTLRLFELAQRHPPVDRLLDAALPRMQALARQTGQSNHLCVHHDARLVVLARAEPPEPMSALVRQGAHFAFHDDRVSARVITAFQNDERRMLMFEELLDGSRASQMRRRRLDERLDAIRARGYDSGPSDTLSGVVDICFPIFDQFGVVAALTVVYLRQRDARITITAARGILQQAAQSISRSLGWSARARYLAGATSTRSK